MHELNYVEFFVVAFSGLLLPLLNTSPVAYNLARYGFGRWFWGTLPVFASAGVVLANTSSSLTNWPTIGMVFHAQWALLIAMYRVFTQVVGQQPRDTYLRGWDEVPDSAKDRIFQATTTIAMLICALTVLCLPGLWLR